MPYGNNGGYNNNNYQPRGPRSAAPRNSAPRTAVRDPQEQSTGPTLFNERAGKFLNFNYWGRYASIEIGAIQPGSPMTWDARKQAQKTSQVISFGDLSDLWDICDEVLESLKNTGTFTSTGLRVGQKQDCMVEINNGSSLNMGPGIYIVIYKNLDSSGRTNNLEFYPCDDVKILRGYDHRTGMSKEDISKVGEFRKFVRCIKESTKAFTMAQAHSVSVNSKNDKLTCFKAMAAITAALGVDMSAELQGLKASSGGSGSGDGGYRRGGGNYGGGSRNYGSAPRSAGGAFENSNAGGGQSGDYQRQQQILATLDDPVDINLSMDNLTNVDMTKFS